MLGGSSADADFAGMWVNSARRLTGWDALFAEAGKGVLTGYKFSTLADQGVAALKVERGDKDADPTALMSLIIVITF